MASSNEAIVAAAGSGKTEYILKTALADHTSRSLIVTYTNENLREINSRLWAHAGGQPDNITAMTWFEFMLRHGIKPYQSYKTRIGRIRSINFVTDPSVYTRRDDFDAYYLDSADNIYSDAVSDLAVVLDQASGGKVVGRLEAIYGKILVDEVQDLAGYDLEFLELLLKSQIEIIMVGDPRQAVYATNRSNKNSQFRGAKIINWLTARKNDGLCVARTMDTSHRCNQTICTFADAIYPGMPPIKSGNNTELEHMGVVLVHKDDIDAYRDSYSAQELRWDRRNALAGPGARNFGQVKGQAFDRVMIHPTGPITEFIEKGTALAEGSAAKFYVGVTRARHSVAIISKKKTSASGLPFWSPSATAPPTD